MNEENTVGRRISDARKRLGYNQSELARQLDVTPQCIQQWERNETTPRGKNLKKLELALQISAQYVLFGTADKGEVIKGTVSEYKAAFYMSKEFERDYLASIESLVAAGAKMGWFGKGVQLKSRIKSLTDFGLLEIRSNEDKQ
ncbi:MAG: helix-turn-helix domain-containing protein [Algicola sp.]|nr:helix-turn-helix domain-containing protein [Algicola sp.]